MLSQGLLKAEIRTGTDAKNLRTHEVYERPYVQETEYRGKKGKRAAGEARTTRETEPPIHRRAQGSGSTEERIASSPIDARTLRCIVKSFCGQDIVTSDVYLNRLKEFVAAGNNPVYPDVVVSIRSVRNSLERFHKNLDARLETINESLRRAKTVVGALEYFLDDQASDEDEDKNAPSKESVQRYTDGKVSNFCFTEFTDSDDEYFDFDRLDEQPIREYLSMTESDPADGAQGENGDGDLAEEIEEDREE